MESYNTSIPYLVIPKLIEQPTWGGDYIATTKGWDEFAGKKIGQSYELFSGSNLSTLTDSSDKSFTGELTDNKAVENATHPPDSIALGDLIANNPTAVLGTEAFRKNPTINLLIKYTQALGNSFQVHIPAGLKHSRWLPKPESWYFFEPGCVTLGTKPDINWRAYEEACRIIDKTIELVGSRLKKNEIDYETAARLVSNVVAENNPHQYVNAVYPEKDQLVDLSCGALHHSWEEDSVVAPRGNILYELQLEALDDVSTFRSFDKGKLMPDGTKRDVQIDEYFEFIDRSNELNDPTKHLPSPITLDRTSAYTLLSLMRADSYCLDRLILSAGSAYTESLSDRYKHLFVKSGRLEISAGGKTLQVTQGHSCFLPASIEKYVVTTEEITEALISYI